MKRIVIAWAVAACLSPTAARAAASPAQLCEAAKLKAASTFAQCRGKADSGYAKSYDAAKRNGAYVKCNAALVNAYASAELKYPLDCPTVGDVDAVRGYLTQCTDDVGAATGTGGGSVPDYVSELAACNADLGSAQAQLTTCNGDKTTCQTSLATAQAGTATAGWVLAGQTFSSSAGLGVTGTMPNNGTVTITPGATAQSLPAGYHNGLGMVVGDPDLVASNIVSGVNMFGVTGTALTGTTITNGLLKTGQTTSYGPGSDGDLQNGTSHSFTDNGNGTVADNRTGLVWEKKSDDESIHDKDNLYTWCRDDIPVGGDYVCDTAGDPMDGTIMTTFLATLNTPPCFAGACDWRIPNLTELESIRNLETFYPATFSAFNTGCTDACTVTTCSCTRSGERSYYWSSTTIRIDPWTAWTLDIGYGGEDLGPKPYLAYVRAVRGGS